MRTDKALLDWLAARTKDRFVFLDGGVGWIHLDRESIDKAMDLWNEAQDFSEERTS